MANGRGPVTFDGKIMDLFDLFSESVMTRLLTLAVLAATLVSCRTYDYKARISKEKGLTPAEQYARYGHEQAELVAAGRELAQAGTDPAALQAAERYARGLPDVVDVTPDSQGHWLTLRFKSGWRAATPPIADGKSGAQTAGVSKAR